MTALSASFDARPLIVLDTNVVLDWLVFRHTASAPLHSALEGGRLRWIATAPMREEWEHVLARGMFAAWAPDASAIDAAWARHRELHAVPPSLPPARALRCTDPDDQKFIDLAVTAGARWLISRDRAVLRLTPRLRGASVSVLTPEAWVASQPADAMPRAE